jgi:hypothetical protein
MYNTVGEMLHKSRLLWPSSALLIMVIIFVRKMFVDFILPSTLTEAFVIDICDYSPVHVMKANRGSRDLTLFLTFTLDRGEWSIADQATVPLRKEAWYPLNSKPDGPQRWSRNFGADRNTLALPCTPGCTVCCSQWLHSPGCQL